MKPLVNYRAAFLVCVAVPTTGAQSPIVADSLVTTHHEVVVGGKNLEYTATAGRLPIINNDAGEPHGYMFFVAYTLDRAPAPNQPARPITFAWNGGPGSSASQVHLLGFGPRRLKTGDTYPTSAPLSAKTGFEDNQESWLDFTDLVFVDPIGTGYSRPTRPEYASEFFNTIGDAESVAELIRVYRQRFDAFDAPIFLAGESYGTVRAQWVAEALERRRTTVAGVVLISGFLRFGQNVPKALAAALNVPQFAATAYYHKKLPPDLQARPRDDVIAEAIRWAKGEYAPALEHVDSVTPAQRDAIVAQLVRFTGVSPNVVDRKTLTISPSEFTDRLLIDQGLDLGRYDTRMTARRDVATIPWTTFIDPSLEPVIDLMEGTSPSLIRYLRSDLRYKSDLMYSGPFGEAYPAPASPTGDWMAMRWARGNEPTGVPAFTPAPGGGGPGRGTSSIPLVPPIRRAMELNPSMRVVVMQGLYDSLAGCETTAYSVSLIEEPFRDRIAFHCYEGGHMMYTDKSARQAMKRDVAALVRGAGGR